MPKKIIMHIDMDYFFAQIEERENPWLKKKPVIVGADPKRGKGRGVVSTCNYIARKYGVRSGMSISMAYKLIPNGVFLPVNMPFYKEVSASIFQIIESIAKTKMIEKVSLDEVYLDMTKRAKNITLAKKIGEKIKKEIIAKENLKCTIGISENKMLAKITCEMAKPNGLKIMSQKKGEAVIAQMPLQTIPGIGPKTEKIIEKHLNKKDIKIKEVRKITQKKLTEMLGKRGFDFYLKFRGKDNSPVRWQEEVKSIGREHTFSKDTSDAKKIISTFKKLINNVKKEAQRKDFLIEKITVICRFEDFGTHSKQKSLSPAKYDEKFLYKKSVPLLLHFITNSRKKIRLIGFRVGVTRKKT